MNLTNIIAKRPNKTVYRDGNLCIKLFNEEYSAADVLNEALNLSIVAEAGVRVPQLHEVMKINGCWAIVQEFVEGDNLQKLMEMYPDRAEEYLALLVSVQLAIHRRTAQRLRHHTDKMHGKISHCGLDATTRYELHTRLEGMPKHYKLLHGDLSPSNIIVMPNGETCIIDWAHATQGNGSADAARTYLLFRLDGKDAWAEKYLSIYSEKSDTAKQYLQRWLAIVAASQLVKNHPEERALLLSWANVAEYQ